MKYLVMETHLSYAVVMDDRGAFLKVANRNYAVGQRLDRVIPMAEPRQERARLSLRPAMVLAACLCLLMTGLWQLWGKDMGTVTVRVNPAVGFHVNRLERVIGVEALNADGAAVLFGCEFYGKSVDQAVRELADRSAELGYLPEGGVVRLAVESEFPEWKEKTETRLESLAESLDRQVTVVIGAEGGSPSQPPKASTAPEPTAPTESAPVPTGACRDDDEWDDDEEDDGNDNRDDDDGDRDEDDGDDHRRRQEHPGRDEEDPDEEEPEEEDPDGDED